MLPDPLSSGPVTPSDIAAILLAAGRSSRMGQPKQLLSWGSQTVVESCVNNLREGGVDRIVVVLGHSADEVRGVLAASKVFFAVNEQAESEMGVSISTGTRLLGDSPEAILIALGDQPAIGAETIAALIDYWRRNRPMAVIPEHSGRGGHPVLLDGSLRSSLLGLDPDQGLRGLLHSLGSEIRRVDFGSPFIARDIDTWQDYRALYEEVFSHPTKG
jgi:molybdenum cofactor cytidylyltransferase